MDPNASAYEQIIARFVAWMQTRPDIRAAIIIGSRARIEKHPADEWADLDIIAFTTASPWRYLQQADWMASIGNLWASARAYKPGGEREWLVVFEGGLDADFAFISYHRVAAPIKTLSLLHRFPWLARLFPQYTASQIERRIPLTREMVWRGVRVLLDKDHLIERALCLLGHPPSDKQPTEEKFSDNVNHFWVMSERKAKKICRGELYVVQSWSLYWMALPMIGWYTGATRGWDYDTWYAGRFLEAWVDPRVVEKMRNTFAHYDRDDMRSALLATMDLFRWLATETADRLGYVYPTAVDERITGLIESLFAERA